GLIGAALVYGTIASKYWCRRAAQAVCVGAPRGRERPDLFQPFAAAAYSRRDVSGSRRSAGHRLGHKNAALTRYARSPVRSVMPTKALPRLQPIQPILEASPKPRSPYAPNPLDT